MLDTNVASHVIRGDKPEILVRLTALPLHDINISAVTEAELLYGVARRGKPPRLSELVAQFLRRVSVLAWDRDAARAFADLKSACQHRGVALAALDMMIAAHAVAAGAVLVSRDGAFQHVPPPLQVEVW